MHPLRWSALAAALLLAALSTSPAAGEVCPIEHAVYAEAEGGVRLIFRPRDFADPAGTTHVFAVTTPFAQASREGEIALEGSNSRPRGRVGAACSEAAGNGAATEGCIYWSGAVYALDASGGRGPFPRAADAPAPPAILLPDFGRQIRYADPDFNLARDQVPRDLFDYAGCSAP